MKERILGSDGMVQHRDDRGTVYISEPMPQATSSIVESLREVAMDKSSEARSRDKEPPLQCPLYIQT